MKRFIYVTAFSAVAVTAMAFGTFTKVFESNYKIGKDSNLAKLDCAVCHVGKKGPKLNPYGEDMATEMKAAKTKKLTAEILKKIENLDSDKDGMKNIDEIKADRNPGVKD